MVSRFGGELRFESDYFPETVAAGIENELRDALESIAAEGANASAAYQGKQNYLAIGEVGRLKDEHVGKEMKVISQVVGEALDCAPSSVRVSFTDDVWVLSVHLTRYTIEPKTD